MALDSKLTIIGEELVVKIESLYSGRIHFTSFVDNLIGITEYRDVKREFRYSTDGLLYTYWIELSNDNLLTIQEIVDKVLFIEVKYTRIGEDLSGEIEFVDISFNGETEEFNNTPTISTSIFSEIANSEDQILSENNLFKKLYFRGIIPQYINRGEERNLNEDRDYHSLFSSIAKFFSFLLVYVKGFQNFTDNEINLREYLRANNITFDEANTTVEDLQYLTRHLYDEIRKRGTDMIFKRKNQVLPSGKIVPVDGEFLRLFKNTISDEFVYEILKPQNLGWNIGNSSPCYRGTSESLLINKTGECSKDFKDISNFSTFGPNTRLEIFDDKSCILLKNVEGTDFESGLGRKDSTTNVSNFLIPIDTSVDYEIIFSFRKQTDANGELQFNVEGFNNVKNKENSSFIKQDGSDYSENFLSMDVDYYTMKKEWYRIRGIIHAYNSKTVEGITTNIGRGNNLIFSKKSVKYILPTVKIKGNSFGAYIWDYKVRPLVRGRTIAINNETGKDYSQALCFLTLRNMLYLYVKNNNLNNSNQEILDFIDKFLVNYNTYRIIQIL